MITRNFACQLTTPELKRRKATIIQELKNKFTHKTELEFGYRFTFKVSDDVLDSIFEFVKSERLCCPFFSFQILINPDRVILDVTGETGAKEFMATELGL
jgi:hypothetical protein